MKLPWWVSLAALLLGAGTVGVLGAFWLQGQRAANQHYADSLRAERSADSAAAAVRNAERAARLATIERSLDSAKAVEGAARRQVAAATSRASAARTERDSAIGALGLADSTLTAIRAVVARTDSAHAVTLAAKDVELASVRSQLADQVRRAGEFEAQIADLKTDLAKQRKDYADLEQRFLDRKPAPARLFGLRLPSRTVMFVAGAVVGAVATR